MIAPDEKTFAYIQGRPLAPKGDELKSAVLDARRHVACRLGMSEPEILALRSDLMALIGRLGNDCLSDAAE